MDDYKKILAVDFDCRSAHRFISLIPIFQKNNLFLKLIYDDNSFIEEEKILEGLLIKNINSYPSRNFLKILNIEKPDLVIVLNMNLLQIRSLNRCCKFLGIPIILLEHGVTSVVGLTNSRRFDAGKALQKRYIRILKGELIFKYFSYIGYFISTKASCKSWIFLLVESILKLIGKDFYTEDWNYSAYCVYLESDKRKLISQLKNTIDKNKIHVVGNYDLNLFKMDLDSFNCYDLDLKSKLVLYVDSDCVERTFYNNRKLYLKYISKINYILNINGFKLRIKLHPNSLNKEIDILLAKLNIISISNNEFIPTLKKSKYVIGEPSSINAIACLTGIPILTPILKPFNKKRYGLVMEEYPNRIDFANFEELGNIIKSKKIKTNKLEINKWINKFAGPLPPSHFPKRVFNVIKQVLDSK
mgnify:CR=1 FL=1